MTNRILLLRVLGAWPNRRGHSRRTGGEPGHNSSLGALEGLRHSLPLARRRVEIGVEVHAPDAQSGRAILGDEQRAAIFIAFAGLDSFDSFDASITELGEQWLNDVILHAQAAAVRDQIAELAADKLPVVVERSAFRATGLGQEREAVEFRLQIEIHEWLGQRRAGEGAIGCEVQRHQTKCGVPTSPWLASEGGTVRKSGAHKVSCCDAGWVADFDFEVACLFKIRRNA
jgi:hypothetical protein